MRPKGAGGHAMKLLVSWFICLVPAITAFKGGRRPGDDAGLATSGESPDGRQQSVDLRSDGIEVIQKSAQVIEDHNNRMQQLDRVRQDLLSMLEWEKQQDKERVTVEGSVRSMPPKSPLDMYVETVELMLNQSMKFAVLDQYTTDKANMKMTFNKFQECLTSKSTGLEWSNAILLGGKFDDIKYSGLAKIKKSHNHCRSRQNDLKLQYDDCNKQLKLQQQRRTQDCDAGFTKLYNSSTGTTSWAKQCDRAYETYANVVPSRHALIDFGKNGDVESFLNVMFNYFDTKLDHYKTAEASCREAERQIEAQTTTCALKLEALANATLECDAIQDELDGLSCQQAQLRHSRCKDYDVCYDGAIAEWTRKKAEMCEGPTSRDKVLAREMVALQQIECVMKTIKTCDEGKKEQMIEKCLNLTGQNMTFSLCGKETPAKDKRQNCGSHIEPAADPDMSGTTGYVSKYYLYSEQLSQGYPLPGEDLENSPRVDVKACVSSCCMFKPVNKSTISVHEAQGCGDCGMFPCKFCDSMGCCSSDARGRQCKRLNPLAKVTCQAASGSIFGGGGSDAEEEADEEGNTDEEAEKAAEEVLGNAKTKDKAVNPLVVVQSMAQRLVWNGATAEEAKAAAQKAAKLVANLWRTRGMAAGASAAAATEGSVQDKCVAGGAAAYEVARDFGATAEQQAEVAGGAANAAADKAGISSGAQRASFAGAAAASAAAKAGQTPEQQVEAAVNAALAAVSEAGMTGKAAVLAGTQAGTEAGERAGLSAAEAAEAASSSAPGALAQAAAAAAAADAIATKSHPHQCCDMAGAAGALAARQAGASPDQQIECAAEAAAAAAVNQGLPVEEQAHLAARAAAAAAKAAGEPAANQAAAAAEVAAEQARNSGLSVTEQSKIAYFAGYYAATAGGMAHTVALAAAEAASAAAAAQAEAALQDSSHRAGLAAVQAILGATPSSNGVSDAQQEAVLRKASADAAEAAERLGGNLDQQAMCAAKAAVAAAVALGADAGGKEGLAQIAAQAAAATLSADGSSLNEQAEAAAEAAFSVLKESSISAAGTGKSIIAAAETAGRQAGTQTEQQYSDSGKTVPEIAALSGAAAKDAAAVAGALSPIPAQIAGKVAGKIAARLTLRKVPVSTKPVVADVAAEAGAAAQAAATNAGGLSKEQVCAVASLAAGLTAAELTAEEGKTGAEIYRAASTSAVAAVQAAGMSEAEAIKLTSQSGEGNPSAEAAEVAAKAAASKAEEEATKAGKSAAETTAAISAAAKSAAQSAGMVTVAAIELAAKIAGMAAAEQAHAFGARPEIAECAAAATSAATAVGDAAGMSSDAVTKLASNVAAFVAAEEAARRGKTPEAIAAASTDAASKAQGGQSSAGTHSNSAALAAAVAAATKALVDAGVDEAKAGERAKVSATTAMALAAAFAAAENSDKAGGSAEAQQAAAGQAAASIIEGAGGSVDAKVEAAAEAATRVAQSGGSTVVEQVKAAVRSAVAAGANAQQCWTAATDAVLHAGGGEHAELTLAKKYIGELAPQFKNETENAAAVAHEDLERDIAECAGSKARLVTGNKIEVAGETAGNMARVHGLPVTLQAMAAGDAAVVQANNLDLSRLETALAAGAAAADAAKVAGQLAGMQARAAATSAYKAMLPNTKTAIKAANQASTDAALKAGVSKVKARVISHKAMAFASSIATAAPVAAEARRAGKTIEQQVEAAAGAASETAEFFADTLTIRSTVVGLAAAYASRAAGQDPEAQAIWAGEWASLTWLKTEPRQGEEAIQASRTAIMALAMEYDYSIEQADQISDDAVTQLPTNPFIEVCRNLVGAELTGYDVTVYELKQLQFNVSVRCAANYTWLEGTPGPRAIPCDEHDLPYNLTGCRPSRCAPKAEFGYEIEEDSLDIISWDVKAKCTSSHIGSPEITACRQEGEEYTISNCRPRECNSLLNGGSIPTPYKLHSEQSLYRMNFSIEVECARMFTGFAEARCVDDGLDYILEGCLPENCTSPADIEDQDFGYAVIERDLKRRSFNVTAPDCVPGFDGIPSVTMCQAHNQPYVLTGCTMTTCQSRVAKPPTGYKIEHEDSLGTHHFRVEARCMDNYTGPFEVKPCTSPNEPYILQGCEPGNCTTNQKTGYAAFEFDLHTATFNVQPSCALMYKGNATVQVCTHHNQPYFLDGCVPEQCLSTTNRVGYVVTHENDLDRPSLDVRVHCDPQYHGNPIVEICTEDNTPYTLKNCTPNECKTPTAPEVMTNYSVDVVDARLPTFNVVPHCAVGYIGNASVTPCVKHNENFALSGCIEGLCHKPSNTVGYVFETENLWLHTWDVNVRCDIPMWDGQALVKKCNPLEDIHEIVLTGCHVAKCSMPADWIAKGYDMSVQSLYKINFSVQTIGDNNGCAENYAGAAIIEPCDRDSQPFKVHGCHPTNCTTPHGFEAAGYMVAETDTTIPDFSVSGSCMQNYHGTVTATVCTEPDTPYVLEGCYPNYCIPPKQEVQDGYIVFEGSTYAPDFQVTVSCAPKYIGTPFVHPCTQNNTAYQMGGCYSENCTRPAVPDEYKVEEFSLERGSFSVTATCTDVTKQGQENKAYPCKAHGEPYVLKGC